MNTLGMKYQKLPLYETACRMAVKWHSEQTYGDSGKPYIYHLVCVARIVMARNSHLPDEQLDKLMTLAMLHDILEDTECDLFHFQESGIPIEIGIAAVAITKQEGEKKRTYLKRCANDSLALEVKICDTLTNLEHSVKARSFKRIDKYADQLRYLNERQRQEQK